MLERRTSLIDTRAGTESRPDSMLTAALPQRRDLATSSCFGFLWAPSTL